MRTHTEMSEDEKQYPKRDPLIALVQIEEEDNLTIREEAVVLLEMLLENVEEFYELREKIIDLMEDDEMTENKLIDVFQTLLSSELTAGRTGLARARVK